MAFDTCLSGLGFNFFSSYVRENLFASFLNYCPNCLPFCIALPSKMIICRQRHIKEKLAVEDRFNALIFLKWTVSTTMLMKAHTIDYVIGIHVHEV